MSSHFCNLPPHRSLNARNKDSQLIDSVPLPPLFRTAGRNLSRPFPFCAPLRSTRIWAKLRNKLSFAFTFNIPVSAYVYFGLGFVFFVTFFEYQRMTGLFQLSPCSAPTFFPVANSCFPFQATHASKHCILLGRIRALLRGVGVAF